MMYVDFPAGNKEYKLRMSMRAVVNLEKQLGQNPLTIFGSGDVMPTLTDMMLILHASLQQYQHGITIDDTYDIFECWLNEGNSMTDFIPVIIEIFKVSGIIKNDAEKNV